MIVVKSRRETSVSSEALFALVNDAYSVWSERGLDAQWMHRTLEEFKKATSGTMIFVALDAISDELLGMHCYTSNWKKRCAYGFYLAVSPKAGRRGIASQMLTCEEDFMRCEGFTHLEGLTATSAEWSVRWHLRNGYQIIGYRRSPNDNFANYVFRKQLVPSVLWDSAFYCRCRYLLSYTITRLTKDPQGHYTQLGRIAKRVSNRLVEIHRRNTTSH